MIGAKAACRPCCGFCRANCCQFFKFDQTVHAPEYFKARKRFFHEVVGADPFGVKLFSGLFVTANHDDRNVLSRRIAAHEA